MRYYSSQPEGRGTVRIGIAPRVLAAEQDVRELRLALGAACRSTPEPEPAPRTATELAMALLHAIAEDPLICASYRVRARKHFRRLADAVAGEREARP